MCYTISPRLHAFSLFGCNQKIIVILEGRPTTEWLSVAQLAVVPEKLKECKGKMPSEFARQPGVLDEMKRWKATGYRQFLFYTGYLVLESVLSLESYSHFLCL